VGSSVNTKKVDLTRPDVVPIYLVGIGKDVDQLVLVSHQVVKVREGRLRDAAPWRYRSRSSVIHTFDLRLPREGSFRSAFSDKRVHRP
jgi:hypothetical protein